MSKGNMFFDPKTLLPLIVPCLLSLSASDLSAATSFSAKAIPQAPERSLRTPEPKTIAVAQHVPERDINDDEIREFGRIIDIEDSGYPLLNVTVSFPERNREATFLLNVEAIDLDMAQLLKLQGKYATLFYVSDAENSLLDLQIQGQSLFGDDAPKRDPDWRRVTGKLGGAGAPTAGDLPGEISVIDKTGKKVSFDFFITPEIVEANGLEVTAYFERRFVEEITYLRPSQD